MSSKWEASGEACPKCGQETEMLITEIDGYDYQEAERCPRCKWAIRFDED